MNCCFSPRQGRHSALVFFLYSSSMSIFDEKMQEGDKVVYNPDLGCRVNLSQLNRIAKKDNYVKADYCSKELCLLLRKKGIEASHSMRFEKGGSWYNKYTLDIACKWLRERHFLHIQANLQSFFQEQPKKLYYKWQPIIKPLPHCKYHANHTAFEIDEYFESYSEAIEKAIEYTVTNLI